MSAAPGLSQPTVSYHMKQLVEAGLVTREQRGKGANYRIIPRPCWRLAARTWAHEHPDVTGNIIGQSRAEEIARHTFGALLADD